MNCFIKNKSGMTLIETLVSILIFLLLMSVSSQILMWSIRFSNEEKGLASIKKETIKSINWLVRDFRQTSAKSLYMSDYPVSDIPISVSLLSPLAKDDIDSSSTKTISTPQWKVFVLYYLKPDPASSGTQKYLLTRKTFYDPSYKDAFNDSMTEPEQLSYTHLICLCNETISGETNRTVARNIYQLDILDVNMSVCTIKVTARDIDLKGGEMEATSATTVRMRNTINQAI